MIRRFFVWLHRWAGLVMAAFLILVGLTGSVLVFRSELEELLAPQLYTKAQQGVARLDFTTLTDRAEALVPQGQVYWIVASPKQIRVAFQPRINPATGQPYSLDLAFLFLNPWTGEELARSKPSDPDPLALINTILYLHEALCLGQKGFSFLGIVAVIWTIDCFVAFYLTLPANLERFWQRWKVAWQVKWQASAFRVNFDLHRASGLWLWPMLLLFAVSGVYFNLPAVYHRVANAIFDYQPQPNNMSVVVPGQKRPPRIEFRAAIATAQRMMAKEAASHGFALGRPVVFEYEEEQRNYFYNLHTSRDVWSPDNISSTTITFDADTGAVASVYLPTGEHTGNTVEMWLDALHRAWVFGLPYRILVCVLGLVIAMLSYTGVYIWWRKREGRILAARKQQASFTKAAAQPDGACIPRA